MRVVTNPRIYERPVPANLAWGQVEHWLSVRNAWVPPPDKRLQEILGRLLSRLGVSTVCDSLSKAPPPVAAD